MQHSSAQERNFNRLARWARRKVAQHGDHVGVKRVCITNIYPHHPPSVCRSGPSVPLVWLASHTHTHGDGNWCPHGSARAPHGAAVRQPSCGGQGRPSDAEERGCLCTSGEAAILPVRRCGAPRARTLPRVCPVRPAIGGIVASAVHQPVQLRRLCQPSRMKLSNPPPLAPPTSVNPVPLPLPAVRRCRRPPW
jgi:hypothetical protein